MTTAADIVNQAIQLIGDNQGPLVTGNAPNFDSSPAGIAASQLYTPAVQTIARQSGWDFERNTVALTLSGNTAPFPWTFEYLYPTMGVQVNGVFPPSLADPNDPLPTNWVVANNLVSGVPKKVIQTTQANALAVFSNQPPPDLWDPLFRESVVRLLASEFAMALFGKPDLGQATLEQGQKFVQLGSMRDG